MGKAPGRLRQGSSTQLMRKAWACVAWGVRTTELFFPLCFSWNFFSISRDHHKYAAVKWNTVILNARPFSTPGRCPWQLCWLLFSMQSTSKDQNVGLLVGLSQTRFPPFHWLSTATRLIFLFPMGNYGVETKTMTPTHHSNRKTRSIFFIISSYTGLKKSVYKPTKHQLPKKVAKFSQICNIGDNTTILWYRWVKDSGNPSKPQTKNHDSAVDFILYGRKYNKIKNKPKKSFLRAGMIKCRMLTGTVGFSMPQGWITRKESVYDNNKVS